MRLLIRSSDLAFGGCSQWVPCQPFHDIKYLCSTCSASLSLAPTLTRLVTNSHFFAVRHHVQSTEDLATKNYMQTTCTDNPHSKVVGNPCEYCRPCAHNNIPIIIIIFVFLRLSCAGGSLFISFVAAAVRNRKLHLSTFKPMVTLRITGALWADKAQHVYDVLFIHRFRRLQ